MKITALKALHHRGNEIRPGTVLEVSDELGTEWAKKGLAKISAVDLTRILRGERNRTTPSTAVPVTIHRR